MSEYEVVWSGRGPIPGMTGEGWRHKGNLLLDEAPGPGDWIQPSDLYHANVEAASPYNNRPAKVASTTYVERKVCPTCNIRLAAKQARQCTTCYRKARKKLEATDGPMLCRDCQQAVKPAQWRQGVRRCTGCRWREAA